MLGKFNPDIIKHVTTHKSLRVCADDVVYIRHRNEFSDHVFECVASAVCGGIIIGLLNLKVSLDWRYYAVVMSWMAIIGVFRSFRRTRKVDRGRGDLVIDRNQRIVSAWCGKHIGRKTVSFDDISRIVTKYRCSKQLCTYEFHMNADYESLQVALDEMPTTEWMKSQHDEDVSPELIAEWIGCPIVDSKDVSSQ